MIEALLYIALFAAVAGIPLWFASHVVRNLRAPSKTRDLLQQQGFRIDKFLSTADGVLAFDTTARKIAFGTHRAPRIFDFADVLEYRAEDIPGRNQTHYRLTLVLRNLDHPTVAIGFLFRNVRDTWADSLKVAFAGERAHKDSQPG